MKSPLRNLMLITLLSAAGTTGALAQAAQPTEAGMLYWLGGQDKASASAPRAATGTPQPREAGHSVGWSAS